MSNEKQLNQQDATTTTNYLDKLMLQIEEKIKEGTPFETGFDDLDLPNRKSRLGCNRPGCREGYVFKDNGTMDYCLCYRIEKMRIKMVKSGIPEEYHAIQEIDEKGLRVKQKMYSADITALKDVNINHMLKNYKANIQNIRSEGWNLMFEGPTGSGKTTAACICAKHAIKNGYSVQFLELQELRKLWTGESISEYLTEVKKMIYSVDFLILDDLGQEFVSERTEHQITEFDLLLRQRTSKKLVTIFTTNAQQKNLSERYGERIASLLKKRMVHVIMHREDDMREDKETPDFLFS